MAPNVHASLHQLDLSQLVSAEKPLTELIREEDWESVERRVAETPEEVRLRDRVTVHGYKAEAYPLHYLCKKKSVPSALVESFVEACSVAASTPDSRFQSLPVHIACMSGASLEVVKALVKAAPESLTTPDGDGNLPIHYACFLSSENVVVYLMETSPESIGRCNSRDQTPLHLACSREDVSETVVEFLIHSDKSLCEKRDWQGRLPLHVACMWHAEADIVEHLLKEFPAAVRISDVHGLTPYGISRKRIHLSASDPTIKLIRSYHKKHGGVLLRGRDMAQFASENVSDALARHHHGKPLHARRCRAAPGA